jgi:hypothetical protein
MLNPQRRLYCLSVGTYDFTCCGVSDASDEEGVSQSMMVNGTDVFDPRICSSEITQTRKELPECPLEIAVSQRVYCISSYFPFFGFF